MAPKLARVAKLLLILVLPIGNCSSSIIVKNDAVDGTTSTTNVVVEEWKRIEEEEFEIGYIQSLLVNTPPITSVKSTYQTIEIYNSSHFGKVFVLDNCLQLTERDAPHYNEMLAHVPVMEYLAHLDHGGGGGDEDKDRESDTLPEPYMKVLVLGGGDGYVVSELLKHPQIQRIDHVELDEEVINTSKQYLPWSDAWKSERVNLVIGDGSQFVKQQVEKGQSYHVIVQDASDPFWLEDDGSVTIAPSSVLYEAAHFERLYKLLHHPARGEGGVLMIQAESYNIPSNLESIRKWRMQLQDLGFKNVRYGSISISTYPMGQIGFFSAHAFGGGGEDRDVCMSSSDVSCDELTLGDFSQDGMDTSVWMKVIAQFHKMHGKTLYYHPRVHRR
jgi:spermidine synthase